MGTSKDLNPAWPSRPSALPLSYDSWTTTNPHNTTDVERTLNALVWLTWHKWVLWSTHIKLITWFSALCHTWVDVGRKVLLVTDCNIACVQVLILQIHNLVLTSQKRNLWYLDYCPGYHRSMEAWMDTNVIPCRHSTYKHSSAWGMQKQIRSRKHQTGTKVLSWWNQVINVLWPYRYLASFPGSSPHAQAGLGLGRS